jgi:hypothetical protein
MQVWKLLYTNLVGPRGEKLESTEPFWCFFLFTCPIREVVWTLFTYGGCNTGGSSVPWSWSFFCKKSHRSSLINLVFFMFNDCSQCVVLSVQHSYIILRVMQFRDFNILLQMYLKAISVLETNPRQMHQGILHSKALAILSATKLSQEQLILCHR